MSTNQTERLQLHQWQSGDTFSREEFNENFQRIDAGVAAAETAAASALAAYKSANDKALTDAQAAQTAALNAYKSANDKALTDGLAAQTTALDAYKSTNGAALGQAVKRVKLKETTLTATAKNVVIDLAGVDLSGYRQLEVDLEIKGNTSLQVALLYNRLDDSSTAYTYTFDLRTYTGWYAAMVSTPTGRIAPLRWTVIPMDGAVYSTVTAFDRLPIHCTALVGELTKLVLYAYSPGNGVFQPGTTVTTWGAR